MISSVSVMVMDNNFNHLFLFSSGVNFYASVFQKVSLWKCLTLAVISCFSFQVTLIISLLFVHFNRRFAIFLVLTFDEIHFTHGYSSNCHHFTVLEQSKFLLIHKYFLYTVAAWLSGVKPSAKKGNDEEFFIKYMNVYIILQTLL